MVCIRSTGCLTALGVQLRLAILKAEFRSLTVTARKRVVDSRDFLSRASSAISVATLLIQKQKPFSLFVKPLRCTLKPCVRTMTLSPRPQLMCNTSRLLLSPASSLHIPEAWQRVHETWRDRIAARPGRDHDCSSQAAGRGCKQHTFTRHRKRARTKSPAGAAALLKIRSRRRLVFLCLGVPVNLLIVLE
jgi:hypothetical protein